MDEQELQHFDQLEKTILGWLAQIKVEQGKINTILFDLHRSLRLALERETAYESTKR